MPVRFNWWDYAWLLVIGVLSSTWIALASRELGATFDEPVYLLEGVKSWRTGSNKQFMTWGTMPLPVDLQTLPIYLWEKHRGEPFDIIGQLHEVLPLARATTHLFWWLTLVMAYRWAMLLGGRWAARIASTGLATDPNLLGHACLATTDIALVGMVLLSTYSFYTGRHFTWRWRVLVPGLLFGLALTSKASALPYVPLLGLVLGLHDSFQKGELTSLKPLAFWRQTRQLRWDLFFLMLIGLAVVFLYCGTDWSTEPTFIAWAEKLPEGTLKKVMVSTSTTLKIFPNAGEGLIQQIKHNMRGHHGTFLAGRWSDKPVWYYFPVALSIKLPESTLVLLGLVCLFRGKAFFTSPAAIAVVVLLVFSFNTRVQIGVRLVFPCVAFLWIALGVACTSGEGWRQRVLSIFAGLAIVASIGSAVQTWPDGLRYANRFWGGPDRVYEHLTDSNADWGQGLPELKSWWVSHEQPVLHVWYYGIDPDILRHPFHWLPVNTMPKPSLELVQQTVGDGCLAVSVSLLNGCPDRRPETLAILDYLKKCEPIGQTRNFRIYRFKPK